MGPPSTSGRGQIDRIGPTGDGMCFYPSGNIAVVVCKQPSGALVTFMSDHKDSQVLACFDSHGVGSVNYTNGKPWLVVTEEGYSISDKKGNIIERSKFPRQSQEEVTLDVSEHLVVRFTNKQSITATFSCEEVLREWPCGECLRRTEPYTARSLSSRKGKHELDVGAIRQRQRDVGSLYVPPGPHHQQSTRPGLGSLRKSLRALDPAGPLGATISDLTSLDTRVRSIDTRQSMNMLSGTSRSGASLGSTTCSSLEDFGSPPLSATQRRYKATMRSADHSRSSYAGKRLKLPWMRTADVDAQTTGSGVPADTLFVLVVLADWNPVCSKVEAQAEAAHGQLAAEAAANAGSESARIKVYKVDASEGNLLQERYGFRTVPMMLMHYGGKLVTASNSLRTASELHAAALDALARGRKGAFLPEGFKFSGGRDNTMLDYIHADMVLKEL